MISPRRNCKTLETYDAQLYKARLLIENFFPKLKQYQAIATRYHPSGGELSGVRFFWLLRSSG
ncbi:hypothetical protein [Microcoleus sp. M2_D4]|uniref:hypothetical protein n=1 Tax=Microcoleus sp. M2_D4 TaxID=3055375 RepID=UPI002FD3C2BD